MRLALSAAIALTAFPALADTPVSKYGAVPRPPIVVVRPRPVVVVRQAPPPVVVYAAPRPVETPIFSIGSRCVRILGVPLVCGGR